MSKDYDGGFNGRNTCYSITDVQFICVVCGKKQFVSKASIKDCLSYWYRKGIPLPSKGINALCKCGFKSTKVDIPEIIKELKQEK
jgi:hypothetical protein